MWIGVMQTIKLAKIPTFLFMIDFPRINTPRIVSKSQNAEIDLPIILISTLKSIISDKIFRK